MDILLVVNEGGDEGDTLPLPTMNFDPDQPRDEDGKWTDSGGGGGADVAKAGKSGGGGDEEDQAALKEALNAGWRMTREAEVLSTKISTKHRHGEETGDLMKELKGIEDKVKEQLRVVKKIMRGKGEKA